jgi:fluoride exporter
MWLKLLCVAGGGAFGALARFGISTWVMSRFGAAFPWGTLAVNLIGCLLIGLFSTLLGAWPGQEQLKPLVITGFLGAMTTFSTFSLESWQHLEQGRVMVAATNIIVSCVLGLALVALGLRLGRALLSLSGNGG